MNKKRSVVYLSLILAFVIFLTSFTLAANQTNTTTSSTTSTTTSTINLTGFEKSYQCLENSIDAKTNKYQDMTLEELAFSLMALAHDSTRKSAITDEIETRKDTTNNCWPKDACTIKETSQVLLAYDFIKKDTKDIQNWLLNQTSYSTELVWYLQIDAANATQCKITYDNLTKTVTVGEDKKITGNFGGCFSSAYDGYWLGVSNTCIGKQFEITCDADQGFLTSTFYKRSTGSTYYVSDLTNTAPANGKTQEKIESLCFKQSGSCNYEGSLWATLALQKSVDNKETLKKFLPYLITLYEDSNSKRYFPATFLYAITGYVEYFSEISNKQNTLGYWQITDTSKRYYDTALALLTLYGKSTSQAETAISYLLDPKVQGEGCWQNSIRDTAFILYSADPKPASTGSLTPRSKCTDFTGYSCISFTECNRLNGTDISKNFDCFGSGICCDKEKIEPTCSEKSGKKCLSTEECDGSEVLSSDTSKCCIGECIEATIPPTPETIPCIDASYNCKLSCSSNEEPVATLDCGAVGETCCKPKETKSYWWLWLLLILIILIALAIVFREKIKIWWFKLQSKFSKQPVQAQRPIMPQQRMPMQGMPMQRRPMMPTGLPQRQVPVSLRPFPKDNELDATLKKLKDM